MKAELRGQHKKWRDTVISTGSLKQEMHDPFTNTLDSIIL